jgi:hypothetical protein
MQSGHETSCRQLFPKLATIAIIGIAASCQNISRIDDTVPGRVSFVVDQTTAQGTVARIGFGPNGRLRFETPLFCEGQEFVELTTNTTVRSTPNVATFVVGVVISTVGIAATVRSLSNNGRSNDPLTYLGPVAVATGAALMIGPWFGNGTTDVPGPTEKRPRFKRRGECGARAIAGRAALIEVRGIRVYGSVDDEGLFSVPAYQLVDAFEQSKIPSWDMHATLWTAEGERQINCVLDASVIAANKKYFLKTADFDSSIKSFNLTPQFDRPTLRASLTTVNGTPAVRVVIAMTNSGPGDAWAMRAHLIADVPDIDGRVIYFGAVAAGKSVQRELLIPITSTAEKRLASADVALSVDFADAYGAAPSVPVRFVATMLHDAPR